ncbi:MAG: T9SS type A sorting domain-containing protein [Flavobacteriales bacterium]|nr:T9SS type A sorting domain-containing protein [Flavobacteriales bacterium]
MTAWTGNSLDEPITFSPDLSNAVVGINTLFIRSRTSDGRWSLTNHSAIVVIDLDTTIGVIDRIETFALPGVDPGFGNADQHTVTGPGSEMTDYVFTAPIPVDLVVYDTLMVRSHDSRGFWSLTNKVIVAGYTNVEDLASATNISVYPNPFAEGFTVKTEDGGPLRVILYDPQGKLVYDRVITGNTDRLEPPCCGQLHRLLLEGPGADAPGIAREAITPTRATETKDLPDRGTLTSTQ